MIGGISPKTLFIALGGVIATWTIGARLFLDSRNSFSKMSSDWEYVFFTKDGKKKCELEENDGLIQEGGDCSTDWSKWVSRTEESKDELIIRVKKSKIQKLSQKDNGLNNLLKEITESVSGNWKVTPKFSENNCSESWKLWSGDWREWNCTSQTNS